MLSSSNHFLPSVCMSSLPLSLHCEDISVLFGQSRITSWSPYPQFNHICKILLYNVLYSKYLLYSRNSHRFQSLGPDMFKWPVFIVFQPHLLDPRIHIHPICKRSSPRLWKLPPIIAEAPVQEPFKDHQLKTPKSHHLNNLNQVWVRLWL